MSETPKKKRPIRGRPEKQPSCNNFWRVYSVNSKHITESTIKIVFLRRISSKNQREKAWRNVLSTCLRNSAFPARKVCLSQTECVLTVQRKSLMPFSWLGFQGLDLPHRVWVSGFNARQLLQRNVLSECPVRLILQIPESKQEQLPQWKRESRPLWEIALKSQQLGDQ